MARSRIKRIRIIRSGGRTRVKVTVRTTGAKSKRAARKISRRIAKRTARRILRRETEKSATRRIVKLPPMTWTKPTTIRRVSNISHRRRRGRRRSTVSNDNGGN